MGVCVSTHYPCCSRVNCYLMERLGVGQQRERSTSEDEVGDGSTHLSSEKISQGLMTQISRHEGLWPGMVWDLAGGQALLPFGHGGFLQ